MASSGMQMRMATGALGERDVSMSTAVLAKKKEYSKDQERAFVRWINARARIDPLLKANPLENLEDLASGVFLVRLMKCLFDQLDLPKYVEQPKTQFHALGNLESALKMASDAKVKDTFVKPKHFLDTDTRMILGFIWALILRYQFGGDEGGDVSGARDTLLAWCKKVCEERGVKIDNFTSSWKDGLGFLCLCHKLKPTLVDIDEHRKDKPEENLELGFKLAEENLCTKKKFFFPLIYKAIARILDVDDFSSAQVIDEKAVITYISEFYHEWAKNEEANKLSEEEIAARIKREAEALAAAAKKKAEEEAAAQAEAEAKARAAAEEKARREAKARRKAEKDAKETEADMEALRRTIAQLEERLKAEEKARKEAEARAAEAAEARRKAEADALAQIQNEQKKRKEAEAWSEAEAKKWAAAVQEARAKAAEAEDKLAQEHKKMELELAQRLADLNKQLQTEKLLNEAAKDANAELQAKIDKLQARLKDQKADEVRIASPAPSMVIHKGHYDDDPLVQGHVFIKRHHTMKGTSSRLVRLDKKANAIVWQEAKRHRELRRIAVTDFMAVVMGTPEGVPEHKRGPNSFWLVTNAGKKLAFHCEDSDTAYFWCKQFRFALPNARHIDALD